MPKSKSTIPPLPPRKPAAPTKEEVAQADAVIRRMTATDEVGTGKYANLPLVSAVFASTEEMRRAIELLETGHRLKDVIEKADKGWDDGDTHVIGLSEAKDELTAIALGADIPGYRYGALAVAVNTIPGRKTLSKDKLRQILLDEGVDPTRVGKIIEEAHTEGDPYYRVEFKMLAK